MQPDILLTTKLPDPALKGLAENFTCHKLYEADDKDALLREVGGKVRAMVTSGFRGYDRALLDALPKLEFIAVWGAGLQALDLDAARERGIGVMNTPDNSKIAVAELGLALLLSVSRRICESDVFVKSGRWENEAFGRLGVGLYGKTCGVVALGVIGRAVADRAAAFGMKVCYFGPRKKADAPYDYYDDVEALAKASDFLILCCPETPETRGLIDARVLKALGPQGILVNIARGAVVDEDALITALQDGTIRAAASDVFVHEPKVPEALRKLDNAVLVPHIGSSTEDVRRIRNEKVVANLKAYFAGEPLPEPPVVAPGEK